VVSILANLTSTTPIKEQKMRRRAKSKNKPKGKKAGSGSVNRLSKNKENTVGDTALELVEVYESVERSYRAAVMAGETHAGVAYSTNY
jgi:hypothetical protein